MRISHIDKAITNKLRETELLEISSKNPEKLLEDIATYGVVKISDPPTDPTQFVTLLSSLGPLMFTHGETPVDGHPELNIVTNVNRQTKPKSVFHSDTSYVAHPPAVSALFAVDVPKSGGATIFTDQYLAFELLDENLKTLLPGAMVLHGATGVPDERSRWHPLIRTNPITKRKALFLTSLPRCLELRLADGTDRSDLLEFLYHFSISKARSQTHRWSTGDVIMWDNRCTLHAADHNHVVGNRTLYRGLITGEKPIPG